MSTIDERLAILYRRLEADIEDCDKATEAAFKSRDQVMWTRLDIASLIAEKSGIDVGKNVQLRDESHRGMLGVGEVIEICFSKIWACGIKAKFGEHEVVLDVNDLEVVV